MTNEYHDEMCGLLPPPGINDLADRIRRAIGAGSGEMVKVSAPSHRSRMDGTEITYCPVTREEFEALRTRSSTELTQLGLRPWDESGLLLFPYEWYSLIPNGFEVVDINGNVEIFERGKTNNDCRYGVLAYGIVSKNEA